MASLDSFLNVIIPIGIFIFFGVLIGKSFKKELASGWDWLTEKITGGKIEIDPSIPNKIIYER
jgi:hypothetical protein